MATLDRDFAREHKPFRHGNHICSVYANEEEQIAVAASYIADGLGRGDRCLYAGYSPQALQRFRAALAALGVDVAAAEARGALWLCTKEQAHLQDGVFDCQRMLRMLNDGVEQALDAGFAGFRTCGDMSWLLCNAAGSEQVIEYEALLNRFFENVRALGMCQYDMHRLPDMLLNGALATHSSVVVDGRHVDNPSYRPAAEQLGPASAGSATAQVERLRGR
jgi:hypothetical protein